MQLFTVIPTKKFHPFKIKICDRISFLESNKSNYVICVDININTLENTSKTIDYINALTSIGCKMTIRNPTRFANNCSPSLLEDHVYTNISSKNTSSGVSMFKISDHLQIFFLLKHSNCDVKKIKKYKRCMKNFIPEEFLNELKNKLSNIAFEPYTASIDDNVSSLIAIFKDILDRHAPLRPMSKKEQRLSNKPWITPGILNSIKTKNKLFQNYFKSNNPDKKKNCTRNI